MLNSLYIKFLKHSASLSMNAHCISSFCWLSPKELQIYNCFATDALINNRWCHFDFCEALRWLCSFKPSTCWILMCPSDQVVDFSACKSLYLLLSFFPLTFLLSKCWLCLVFQFCGEGILLTVFLNQLIISQILFQLSPLLSS